jgi:DNA-binding transcriptional LysR family regulator
MDGLSCLTKGVSRLPPPPSRAIVSIRTMSAESRHEAKKVEAVIYLSTNRPLHLPDFLAEFHQSWPHLSLQKAGKEPHRALFRVGKSDFALELHHTPVPQEVTGPVVHSTLHWPMAFLASPAISPRRLPLFSPSPIRWPSAGSTVPH